MIQINFLRKMILVSVASMSMAVTVAMSESAFAAEKEASPNQEAVDWLKGKEGLLEMNMLSLNFLMAMVRVF